MAQCYFFFTTTFLTTNLTIVPAVPADFPSHRTFNHADALERSWRRPPDKRLTRRIGSSSKLPRAATSRDRQAKLSHPASTAIAIAKQ
jgi:hypothetical protein